MIGFFGADLPIARGTRFQAQGAACRNVTAGILSAAMRDSFWSSLRPGTQYVAGEKIKSPSRPYVQLLFWRYFYSFSDFLELISNTSSGGPISLREQNYGTYYR
jgi:hypothetical protein